MGYCICMKDQKFSIKSTNVPNSLLALKTLGNGSNDTRARGGSYQQGRMNKRWFSWMNGTNPEGWKTIQEAMEDWGYPVTLDENDNVCGIGFVGEKIGDEELMFQAIAPFVEPGSWIEMVGEDGDHWKCWFDGRKMVIKRGEIVY